MRWIFENPQILLLIAGAVAYWLTQRRQQKEMKREAEEELGREPTEDEMAERTRRIQEEIRRKIAERMGQAPIPAQLRPAPREPATYSAPVPPPLPRREAAAGPTPMVVVAEAGTGAAELELVMAQQRRYAEQLQQLESLSRTAPTAKNVAAASAFAFAGSTPSAVHRGLGLLAGLHDREALRRAILLREILGPAKGLQ